MIKIFQMKCLLCSNILAFLTTPTFSSAWIHPSMNKSMLYRRKIYSDCLRGRRTTRFANTINYVEQEEKVSRRDILQRSIQIGTTLLVSSDSALAMEQRCDASNVRCGPDGKLGELPAGKSIPRVTNRITHVVQIIMDIGERREEAVFIRFGLYGDDCPSSVKQMLQFLTTGLSSMDKETLDNSIGIQTAPVSLIEGGAVPNICSGKAVDFGVPSQSKAYAKSRGLRAAGPNFVPQTPPPSLQIEDEFPRTHSVAGLVSVPAKGIGYAGATEDDEAYSSAFLITADEVPALDKMGRRVIGQVIDAQSMQFLARLASLPVQRGKNGIIPGQTSGPPLLKVRVRDVGVQKVKSKKEKSKK